MIVLKVGFVKVREYDQTNPRHHEKEPQKIYSKKTSKRQQKQSNQLSLPRQNDCKTRMDKNCNA